MDPTSARQIASDTPVRGRMMIRGIPAARVATALAVCVALTLMLRATPVTAALRQYAAAKDLLRQNTPHSGTQPQLLLPAVRLPLLLNQHPWADSIFSIPRDVRGKHTLFVLFTYADCYQGLADVPLWTEIQRRYGSRILVLGVTSEGPPAALRHFLERQNVTIPVANDSTGALFAALYRAGYLTPAMVLADSTGTVIRVDGSRYGSAPLQLSYLLALDGLMPPSPRTATPPASSPERPVMD